MKKLIILLSLLYSVNLASAQVSASLRARFHDTVETLKYKPEKNGLKYQFIDIEAGDYRIMNLAKPRLLNNETIVQIDLVYTDYPEGSDMTELNRKRMIELYMHCPNAFNNPIITWRLVKQVDIDSEAELKKSFHGFVVYYRPLISYETEREYFEKILAGKDSLQDSTLIKVLMRNTQWKEMLCVADVTGSMSPYTVQLLLWMKFNEKLKTFKQFVFFNDDEEKSTDQSQKYDSSGIWDIETFKSEKLFKQILVSMEEGSHYENDLEAIFYAIKKYPDNIKNIILIADNWEDPCDMALLPKLKALNIPVRVVICGVNSVINTNYLEIAYATKGSVHTMEEDLTEMSKLTNGKVFTIQGLRVRMINGKFYQIR